MKYTHSLRMGENPEQKEGMQDATIAANFGGWR
jgi:hypothetical protein